MYDKEYDFKDAWNKLLDNNVIVSKKTKNKYKIDQVERKAKLKFYNPIITAWQNTDYILSEEILNKWYISNN